MKHVVFAALLTTGCWNGERSSLPVSVIAFEPEAGSLPGWEVTEQDVDVSCPDGRNARFYLLHPADTSGPVPVAILYHSGSFDFIDQPEPGRPLVGASHQEVGRLESAWAIRTVFATLGMYPDPLEDAVNTGALPLALAEQGVAVMLPMNCWGDLWHNKPGTRENDFFEDQFLRAGGVAAEWPWRLLVEPDFARLVRIELPFEVAAGQISLIGLGEGGRAVGEVLAYGASPASIVVEGHNDDLDAWLAADPEVRPGLNRIFSPTEDKMDRAISSASELPPTLWIWSSLDPFLASGSQDRVLPRLVGSDHQIIERTDAGHLRMNEDAELAADVAAFIQARF